MAKPFKEPSMTTLTTTCPHCRAELIAMRVMGLDIGRNSNSVSIFTSCARCLEPSCHILAPAGASRVTKEWFATSQARTNGTEILTASGWKISETFPKPLTYSAPESTPAEIARIYLQARSAHARKEFDGAAMLYRKTLETAVKNLDATATGSLDARIKALSKSDLIPKAVATWAHEIRGIGNEAAHDADEPAEEDVAAAAQFVEAFLLYAFTMPEKIATRMTKPAQPLIP